ncbi:ParB/Srx family N-terminal domain-containing protein [Sphingomicrobium sp. XHP0239]|uniref:ParB/Srx family N-terminal domain-containing protein n=1 Tax=Sphingomicrobium maritimum TaxID=3133972 RepID=UPI0031CC7283
MSPQIESRRVSDLIPYERNARTHSASQVSQLAASIREFGWTNPLLIDGKNNIIAGHGRMQAALKLGIDEVPVLVIDHLDDAQRKALGLADNKLALNAAWDEQMLALEVSELQVSDFDMKLIGFSNAEIADLSAEVQFMPADEGDQTRLDEKPLKMCPACGHEF